MSGYPRSVLFRFLGVLAGSALWLGLIVLALANFDSPAGFPEDLQATWPFWLVAVLVTAGVYLLRRRLGPGAGWGSFALGILASFLALLVNARTGAAVWFWLILAVAVLVPLPSRRPVAAN